MGKMLIGVGLAVALVCAPTAAAQPSQAEVEFVKSVDQDGFTGPDVIPAGYGVCRLLDDRMSKEGIERFIADTFNDRREHAPYYATWFAKYATYHLCPRHLDKYGPI